MSTRTRSFRVLATCIMAALATAATAGAGVVTIHYDFSEPMIETAGEYVRVTMDGAWSYGAPGEPALPMYPARVLLPPGEVAVDVTVRPGERLSLGEGHIVEPGQPQYPLSYDGPVNKVEPDYAGRATFPGRLADEPRTGLMRGHSIAALALHPVEYEPRTGALYYYRSMDLVVTTAVDPDVERSARSMVRTGAATRSSVARVVDNPSARERYEGFQEHAVDNPLLPAEPAYDYIVITTDAWDDYLGDFVELKEKRGFRTGLFLKSWVLDRYDGIDEPQQIRRFIRDAYRTWGTEYVLLVGDARDENGIPHRGLYATADGGAADGTRPEVDTDIPGDIYYAALDGTWNSDGDGWWGEKGEADLYPDIAVGRLCVNEYWELENFTDKVRNYEQAPIVEECDNVLMVGEYLWPDTYGGTYKDEIRYGSSAHGYTTAGIPDRMNVETLYERDVGTWDPGAVIHLMQTGANIVNHLGHCNLHYVMKMSPTDITGFTNDGTEHTLNFLYTQGCYGGSFDNKVAGGGYSYDCFIELMVAARVGAAASIANSRYGWGEVGGTNGSSQYYDREFFDAMFAEGIYEIGEANNDSKADVVWAIEYGANRWCSYQLNLFGDPSMHLWTAEPGELLVDRPTLILTDSEGMEVTVRGSLGEPLENARVAAYTDDGHVHGRAYTDATGVAVVDAATPVSGTLHLRVMAHDYQDYRDDIPIISSTEPYLEFVGASVDDDLAGSSHGNADGSVGAGETVELRVALENLGGGGAVGAVARLSCASPYVTFVSDEVSFGDVAADEVSDGSGPFVIELAPDTPDGESLEFAVDVTSSERGSWSHGFTLPVSAPVISRASHYVDDSAGNGNGCPEAGEPVTMELSLQNSGSVQATGVTATLTTSDPYVVVNSSTLSGTALDPGETALLDGEYSLSFLAGCPSAYPVYLDLTIEADWGYSASTQVIVLTAGAGFSDDVENGTSGWYHEAVTEGAADAWHVESWRSRSGEHSWKFGGTGLDYYPASSDGALTLEPVCVSAGGELRFWDWLEAEEESGTTGWDCALVEASTDFGATWDVLEPVGGYTHTKAWSTGNPLPNGIPCWSGSHDWREEVFDLSHLVGESVMLRLRFASDEYVAMEGWYIDDVTLSLGAAATGEEPDSERGLPRTFALAQNAPNPFNPVTEIRYQLPKQEHVRIDVFNVAGKLVRTVVDGPQEAGYRSITWDGTDGSGRRVASGVYLYRMTAGEFESKKMMVLLK